MKNVVQDLTSAGIDSQRDKWGGFASKYLEFGERMAATKADVCLVLSKNMKQYGLNFKMAKLPMILHW